MASVKVASRLAAPRQHLLRSSPAPGTITHLARRTYASEQGRRPASDTKAIEEAELASEDLTDESDPNMVRRPHIAW